MCSFFAFSLLFLVLAALAALAVGGCFFLMSFSLRILRIVNSGGYNVVLMGRVMLMGDGLGR
jgi:hypothetical protein